MLQDLRLGVRMLLKQPGFTVIAVLTLALGIGATSAVFSLIRGVLLTPPPYRQPQQLVLIPAARTDGRQMTQPRGWPAAQWMEWQTEAKSFEALAAYDWSFNFLVLNDGSVSMEGMSMEEAKALNGESLIGEPGGTRTRDPLIKRQMLYRLSYRPGTT